MQSAISTAMANKTSRRLASTPNPFHPRLTISLGDGAGGFSTIDVPIGDLLTSIAVGDFNGDGKQDLVVLSDDLDSVSILLGDGAGDFGAASNFGAGDRSFVRGNRRFQRRWKQDLAVTNLNSNDVSILLGNGAGIFSAAINFGAGSDPF